MPRNRRLTVFVNDDEYRTLVSVSPDDEPIGRTIRRLAMSRATWLAERGHKERGKTPGNRDPQGDGYTLDTSYAQ